MCPTWRMGPGSITSPLGSHNPSTSSTPAGPAKRRRFAALPVVLGSSLTARLSLACVEVLPEFLPEGRDLPDSGDTFSAMSSLFGDETDSAARILAVLSSQHSMCIGRFSNAKGEVSPHIEHGAAGKIGSATPLQPSAS